MQYESIEDKDKKSKPLPKIVPCVYISKLFKKIINRLKVDMQKFIKCHTVTISGWVTTLHNLARIQVGTQPSGIV